MLCLVFMSHAGYMRRSGSPQNNFVFPSSHESSPVPPSSTYSLPALLYNPYPGHRDAGTACKQRVRCYCLPISTLLHCSSSTSPCGNSGPGGTTPASTLVSRNLMDHPVHTPLLMQRIHVMRRVIQESSAIPSQGLLGRT